MSECRVIEWSRAYHTPVSLDRVEPGTVDFFEGELDADIDCAGAGVTVASATPTIRPEDDDGELTFGVVSSSGATFRIPYTVADTAVQAVYAIDVRVTTSDGRTLHYWYSLPVIPTVPLHA